MTGFCSVDVYVAGPVHTKSPLPVANNWILEPSHVCVNVGLADSAGGVLIVMFSVVVAVHPFGLVTVNVYIPLLAKVTCSICGCFWLLEKPLGPVHA